MNVVINGISLVFDWNVRVGKNVWNNSSEESKLMSMIDLICDTMLCYVSIIIEPHRAHGVNLVQSDHGQYKKLFIVNILLTINFNFFFFQYKYYLIIRQNSLIIILLLLTKINWWYKIIVKFTILNKFY